MTCYRDKTFCADSGERCINTKCSRYLSEIEREKIPDNEPVCWGYFFESCEIKLEKEGK